MQQKRTWTENTMFMVNNISNFFFAIFAKAPSTHGLLWVFVATPAKIEQYSLPRK